MKQFLFFLLIPFLSISQVQIGQDIDGEAANDNSGRSVSLSSDGSVVAIGAHANDGVNGSLSGHVRIYENQSGTWAQIGSDIDGEITADQSGISVSISSDGSVVAIGANANSNGVNGSIAGHVRVYENQSGTWTQIGADIDGETSGDQSGWSVCLSSNGDIVAIGAPTSDVNGLNSGHVRIYENQSGIWTQIGLDIEGEAPGDQSGHIVSLSADGSIVAIGAISNDGNGSNSGHVRVFENQSDVWVQIGQDIDGEAAGDQSGWSVSISSDGSIVAIGALFNDGNGTDSGQVRVYENIAGIWTLIGQDIDGEAAGDQSGRSVSLSSNGNIVAIGANGNDENGSLSGHVRIYENQNDVWVQIGQDIDGEAGVDQSGFDLSLNSDSTVVAIGAPNNDGNGTDSGHVRVYDLSALLSSDSFVLENFTMSPNPTTDKVSITLTNNLELKGVTVYNYFGQKLKTTQSTEIDLSELPTGVYIIEIETNKGKASRKVVKK